MKRRPRKELPWFGEWKTPYYTLGTTAVRPDGRMYWVAAIPDEPNRYNLWLSNEVATDPREPRGMTFEKIREGLRYATALQAAREHWKPDLTPA